MSLHPFIAAKTLSRAKGCTVANYRIELWTGDEKRFISNRPQMLPLLAQRLIAAGQTGVLVVIDDETDQVVIRYALDAASADDAAG